MSVINITFKPWLLVKLLKWAYQCVTNDWHRIKRFFNKLFNVVTWLTLTNNQTTLSETVKPVLVKVLSSPSLRIYLSSTLHGGKLCGIKGEVTELAITNKTSESVLLPKLSRWMPGPSLVSFKIFSLLSFNFRLWKVLHNILDLELFILGKLRPSAKRIKKWIVAAIDPCLIWDSFNFCSGACFSKSPVTFRARKAVLCLLCLHSRSKF